MKNHENLIISQALQQARSLLAKHGVPQRIALSLYATDADLRQLRPEDGPDATAEGQSRITHAVADAFRSQGHHVTLITLHAVDYLRWLSDEGLTNSAGHRAQWISLQQTS